MTERLLQAALKRNNRGRPPVWFMRQAGRYHAHYQKLRAAHEFIDLCKQPELAVEVTLGPIEDFGFDAAILFSDLLFPLEAMGLGLRYDPGPKLDWQLRAPADLARLRGGAALAQHLAFQGEALRRLRQRLPASCSLIGFVGGPFTLYAYAAAGSHEGFGRAGLPGLDNGLYAGFCAKLQGLLAANMALQAEAGAEAVAIFDTSAGALSASDYARLVVPPLAAVIAEFRRTHPHTPLIYYSRGTDAEYWRALQPLGIQCLGVDWQSNLAATLAEQQGHWAVQGNIDPHWLHLPPNELEANLRSVWGEVARLPADVRAGWVCGLGHGVLPGTPEENVRLALRVQREMFA
ncbi:MAG: uroporphyrinogen decarboxylase family protein [Steroidobacteraceae bacterium]